MQSNQIPSAFSTETDKAILEFPWKHERPLLAKAILHKGLLRDKYKHVWGQVTLQRHGIENNSARHKNRLMINGTEERAHYKAT